MRRVALSIALVLAVATCSGIDNIDVEAEGQAVIPQRSVLEEILEPFDFAGFGNVDISQSEEFENQGYAKDQIDSVRIIRFTLTISDPPGATFDFMDSIAFTASSDGLPDVEIARLDAIPDGVSTLELEADSSVEL